MGVDKRLPYSVQLPFVGLRYQLGLCVLEYRTSIHPILSIKWRLQVRIGKLRRPEVKATTTSSIEYPVPKAEVALREKYTIVSAPSSRAMTLKHCPDRES